MSEENFFNTNRELVVFAVISFLILTIYSQTTGFDFINLDDNLYVYDNAAVLSGLNRNSINWAFTAFHSANWHPLTWLSHMLDVKIFGYNPGGYHAGNIILHLINSCLAFVVFRKMTGDLLKSAIVAALFAVHPAHVESVAWIAERKDVLSTLFWLLTMWAYIRFAAQTETKSEITAEDETGENQTADGQTGAEKIPSSNFRFFSLSYLLVVIFFALGLMAKPMLVTLPFVLILMDFWSLERLKTVKDLPRLLIEKIPLFVLSAISSYVTIVAQRTASAVESLDFLPLGTRFINAVIAYAKYIVTLFYPTKLAIWYPYDREFEVWQIVGAAVLILAITAVCVWQIKNRKYLLMGWLWFLGTLVPVIGIVQVGGQAMADRYTYVPYFGLFIMLVWSFGELLTRFKLDERVFTAIFAVVIIIFSVLSFNQTKHWRNSETLYTHTLAVTKNNYLISHNLCHFLMSQNRLDEAEPYCQNSIDINPIYANSYNTLGIIKLKKQQYAEGEQLFLKTVEVMPNYALAYNNLAVAQSLLIKPEEAENSLLKAFALSANSIPASVWIVTLNDVAFAYNAKGNYEKAAENLNRILSINPNDTPARGNLALTLSKLKRFDEAQKEIETVIQKSPDDANAYNTYGLILLEQNRKKEAAAQFEKALQIKPDLTEAAENLKKAGGEKK